MTKGCNNNTRSVFVNVHARPRLDVQAQKPYRYPELLEPSLPSYQAKRRFFVFSTLVLALSFIVVAPLLPAITDNVMGWCIMILGIFLLVALVCSRWIDAIFLVILETIFISSLMLFAAGPGQLVTAIRTCSITAFVLLNAVLLVGPWARFTKTVEKLYWFRRHMGVAVFLLGAMHFRLVFDSYFNNSLETAIQSLFTFYGFTAFFLLFFLAATSWDWVQKHIRTRQWKLFNFLIFALYGGFALWAVWINLKNGQQIPPLFFAVLAGFILFWIVVAPWGLITRFMRYVQGWKQLHMLVYIVYAALIMHSWGPLAQFNATFPVYALWVAMMLFVAGSHAAGWIIKWRQEKVLKEADASAEKITVKGFEYRSVGRVEDFREGIGKKVYVAGVPVAVYKIKDRFYAWYAVCPHQKGPLERGTIVKGYLVCPWHQWQFNLIDGCGPAKYGDSTNLYPTEIRKGRVFVSRVPQPKITRKLS